jgi:hypothetical protein
LAKEGKKPVIHHANVLKQSRLIWAFRGPFLIIRRYKEKVLNGIYGMVLRGYKFQQMPTNYGKDE